MSTTTTGKRIHIAAKDRGQTEIDWLNSYHTFSFGDYYNPEAMGFGSLRVINDDVIKASGGFGLHGHRDMEIITIILRGAVEHQDSMGNRTIIRRGEVQRMSAGKGVQHSEFNPSPNEPLHLLQIWIKPEEAGITPSYDQKQFDIKPGGLQLVISPNAEDGSLHIHQDAKLYQAHLENAQSVSTTLNSNRRYWLHVATGSVKSDGVELEAGAALGFSETEKDLVIEATSDNAHIILFDLK